MHGGASVPLVAPIPLKNWDAPSRTFTNETSFSNRPESIVGHPSRDRQGAESSHAPEDGGIPLPDGRGSDSHWSV